MFVFGGLNAPNKGGNLQTFYSCQLNYNVASPKILYRWEKIKGDAPRARDSLTLVNVSHFKLITSYNTLITLMIRYTTILFCSEDVGLEKTNLSTISISLIFVRNSGQSWKLLDKLQLLEKPILLKSCAMIRWSFMVESTRTKNHFQTHGYWAHSTPN